MALRFQYRLALDDVAQIAAVTSAFEFRRVLPVGFSADAGWPSRFSEYLRAGHEAPTQTSAMQRRRRRKNPTVPKRHAQAILGTNSIPFGKQKERERHCQAAGDNDEPRALKLHFNLPTRRNSRQCHPDQYLQT